MIPVALLFLAADIDLSHAVVAGDSSIAATVLVEEVEKRTGVRLAATARPPSSGPAVVISASAGMKPESYRLYVDGSTVHIEGADRRGALFGVGRLLRTLDFGPNKLSVPDSFNVSSAPMYPIRGHQLGYRTQANSYDAWNVAQFEQYIRELTFFGVNSIEAIPFQDKRPTPVMKVPRREMNRAMSEICARYGLDYWAWVPADFDLKDKRQRDEMLARFDEFFRDCPELTALFFPGGDPGNNPPELVLPFLEDVAKRMLPVHPKARIWLSLQQFTSAQSEAVYQYLEREAPKWFAGLVAGPSSPRIQPTRLRLPKQYKLRLYPDITHNKICQYQVPAWDQAYALTLGREAINPRPAEFAMIHNWFAPYSDGFISYSDGIHDDVNKTIFSALSWDSKQSVRDILTEYARVYFDSGVATDAADGILALERNWRGPLIDNGAVEGALLEWHALEKRAPKLESNWRWQMYLLRANYDAFVRRRLVNETALEDEANRILASAKESSNAMIAATATLNRAVQHPIAVELRTRVEDLCEKLFRSIGLQSSVAKYYASGEERGAVLDFLDYPLNNRWWLEDQFNKIRAMNSESDKLARLREIAAWEHPGPGSFYDTIGNVSKSPHVLRGESDYVAPEEDRRPEPTFWWWSEGKSRERLSSQATLWPHSMVYDGLDPDATYVVKTGGYGQSLLRMNGDRIQAAADGTFPVDPKYIKDRKLTLTWDRPTDEGHLNWRQRSRLAEVWLIRKP